ncbi:hypothetical protein AAVH_25031 [Aphelenchoides avenae]|nr:hypothetical protein AAVH_25031 [Aphelenchus avenae]
MTTCHSPSKRCIRRLTWKIPQCYAFPESWLDRDSAKPAVVYYSCPAERWFKLNVDLFNITENTECYSSGGR